MEPPDSEAVALGYWTCGEYTTWKAASRSEETSAEFSDPVAWPTELLSSLSAGDAIQRAIYQPPDRVSEGRPAIAAHPSSGPARSFRPWSMRGMPGQARNSVRCTATATAARSMPSMR